MWATIEKRLKLKEIHKVWGIDVVQWNMIHKRIACTIHIEHGYGCLKTKPSMYCISWVSLIGSNFYNRKMMLKLHRKGKLRKNRMNQSDDVCCVWDYITWTSREIAIDNFINNKHLYILHCFVNEKLRHASVWLAFASECWFFVQEWPK